MSNSVPGVTTCSECGSDLATAGLKGEKPTQMAVRSCPDCAFETTVGVLWFPDDSYVVLGRAEDTAQCWFCEEATETVKISSKDLRTVRECSECTREPYASAYPDPDP